MSTYSAEDPEGRATDTATWRDHDAEARDAEARDAEAPGDAAAADAHGEPFTANGGAGAADPDVIVLEEADVTVVDEEPRGSGAYAGAPAVDPVSPVRDANQGTAAGSPVGDEDREFPRADIAADTGPELTGAGAPGTGPEPTNGGAPGTGPEQANSGAPATGSGLTGAEAAGANGPGLTGAEAAAANGPGRTSTAAPAGPGLADGDVPAATGAGPDDQGAPTVAGSAARTAQLQERWLAIQSDFVDDPRRSVASAADLVTEAIKTLVAEIKERDASLRGTWDSTDADTEVLRNALRDYRSFLDRLVAL